ncbi:uncharacterized protein THITE_2171405 [Thermothielavioides terrestris NRRL 8126]|uniref:Uncharacterized protein n=2 Tax=Thermothielavioides terrestris TaxID=2587410 RepID=G2RCY8_THETT|nr:uncharacterized protein THITE_2171405 [Thermothielavioides terrestris NRRL 8126]AEO70681.1 hypothetical protein THITE_2171405 [Thermothielavioides terrestris NRRL 8126]
MQARKREQFRVFRQIAYKLPRHLEHVRYRPLWPSPLRHELDPSEVMDPDGEPEVSGAVDQPSDSSSSSTSSSSSSSFCLDMDEPGVPNELILGWSSSSCSDSSSSISDYDEQSAEQTETAEQAGQAEQSGSDGLAEPVEQAPPEEQTLIAGSDDADDGSD